MLNPNRGMIGRAVLLSALFVGWNLWGMMALAGGLLGRGRVNGE
ncbi:MAG: hypothetical protein ACT4QB_05965 [Gammaproteobacteria bacterium]